MDKVGRLAFFIMILLCNLAFGANQKQEAASVDYTLSPGQTLTLANNTSAVVSTQCEIHAVANVTNSLSIKMLKGLGSFNGTTLKQGQTMFENVYNTQLIPVVARPGAQAQFINIGTYTLKAHCG